MSERRGLKKLGFLHIVPFDPAAPKPGLDQALELFAFAESLGLDSGWVRTRHLQHGLPAPAAFLAAVSQRTTRLELGTAVIPLGYENPFRLAEDLAVADLLSGGRLQPGLSVGEPWFFDKVREPLFGDAWQGQDFGYGRLEKLLGFLRGERVGDVAGLVGFEEYSDRIQPHSPGLAERVFYGAGSAKSAAWAGEHGLRLLVSNIITRADGAAGFGETQRGHIDLFRASHPAGESAWVAQGHVVVPTDNTTAAQKAKYERYVAERTPRTESRGANGMLIARDLSGTTEQIVEQFHVDPAFAAVDEFLFELPFVFGQDDYRQILTELATNVGPALGWRPAG